MLSWRTFAAVLAVLPADWNSTAAEFESESLQMEGASPSSVFQATEAGDGADISGGAVVRYDNGEGSHVVITAREVHVHKASGQIEAEGDVTILATEKRKEGDARTETWRGEKIRYNFRTHQIEGEDFRGGMPPFFVGGKSLKGGTQRGDSAGIQSAIITTDDLKNPGFRVEVDNLRLTPGESLEGRGARIFIGDTPLFRLLRYHRSLRPHSQFWEITPGYRSSLGPFILTRHHWLVGTNLDLGLDLDYRQKRGVGLGPAMDYNLGKLGEGDFTFYYAHDDLPPKDSAGKELDSDRERFRFRHWLTNSSGFSLTASIHQQSDPLLIHDFFEGEFRRNIQPQSFVEANQTWSNWSLDLLVRPQVNDFFATVERLPDARLSGFRQQVGSLPFYYESESSVGYFRYRPIFNTDVSYAALRADTYHQLIAPKTFFGWLNLSPRIGGRLTHYGELDRPLGDESSKDRWVFNTGIEATAKATRVWPGLENRWLDLHGVRHILEPSINYAYVPTPSLRPAELLQFDSELTSLRLLPIEFPDYQQIDSVDSQNTIRWGLRNRLQTKRKDVIEDWVRWNVFTDWRLRPGVGQKTFPEIYSDLDFSPRTWLTVNSETRYDINGREWREATHRVQLNPSDQWSASVGHRYLREIPGVIQPGNNLIFGTLGYRFNENWAVRTAHYFEARDGVMEEQQYTIYRDLRSWTAAMSVRLRDNRQGRDDWAVVMTFSLKAFPRYRLNEERNVFERMFGG